MPVGLCTIQYSSDKEYHTIQYNTLEHDVMPFHVIKRRHILSNILPELGQSHQSRGIFPAASCPEQFERAISVRTAKVSILT